MPEYIPKLEGVIIRQGETLHCDLCEATHIVGPEASLADWRGINLDGDLFYVCPAHFPTDGATQEEYKQAYLHVLGALIIARSERKGETDGKAT